AFSKLVLIITASFRFLTVTILAFLLLSPLLKIISRTTQKPIIVVAQDNSYSLLLTKDSVFYKNQYKENLQNLITKLSAKYSVETYSFGEKVSNNISYKFDEKETDMASLFSEINDRFQNRNLGAIIIASDGIYNKGSNPIYAAEKINVPIYTIAMGDTTIKKDLVLQKVAHNKVAFLGNTFPLEIAIQANQLKGETSTLTVTKNKQVVFTKPILITDNSFNVSIPVQLNADEKGTQRYRVALSPAKGETNIENNVQDVFVDVVDEKQKVVILSDAPDPDIGALKQAIDANQNYEAEVYLLSDFTKSLAAYNLVILDQLPSLKNNASQLLKKINEAHIPVVYIVGSRSSLPEFDALKTGLDISGIGGQMDEVTPSYNDKFTFFTISDASKNYFPELPAIKSPFGNYRISTASSVLLYQKKEAITTQNPLIVFNQNADLKNVVIAAEGIWRWRIHDYLDNSNHDFFQELVDKTTQYLLTKEDKSFFRINANHTFNEDEPITMDAEVYNQSYELVNDNDVLIHFTNDANKKFDFTFSKTSNAYHLDAGELPTGNYTYEATTKVGEKVYAKRGAFIIHPLHIEAANTIANHQLMYQLAHSHDGEMVYPQDLQKISDDLDKRDDLKSVVYSEKKLSDLVDLKGIFFLLLFLLSTEWFLRKRNGAY
ncbi:MAG TPA: hypothetical protein VNG53_03190, partial [Bacteroidia bacterium]|nr:hypothetical protein [Bacteroidia bacterium]